MLYRLLIYKYRLLILFILFPFISCVEGYADDGKSSNVLLNSCSIAFMNRNDLFKAYDELIAENFRSKLMLINIFNENLEKIKFSFSFAADQFGSEEPTIMELIKVINRAQSNIYTIERKILKERDQRIEVDEQFLRRKPFERSALFLIKNAANSTAETYSELQSFLWNYDLVIQDMSNSNSQFRKEYIEDDFIVEMLGRMKKELLIAQEIGPAQIARFEKLANEIVRILDDNIKRAENIL